MAGLVTMASSGSGTFQSIAADANGIVCADDPWRLCLKEDFGAFGCIDTGVDVAAVLRFLLPGRTAALVGHTGGPDVLAVDRRQRVRRIGGRRLVKMGGVRARSRGGSEAI